MSFLKKHEDADKKKKANKKIESELPFFITIVTLLATSGLGPYTIFTKIKDLDLLPNVRIESIKILKKIDILGKDPLVVMAETKEKGISSFGEFLSGWVSSIQSGGDVVSYLKSKMDSAFEVYESQQKESANKVQTLVETYMTMQIVILAIYIIVTATSTGGVGTQPGPDDIDPLYLVIMLPPIITTLFLMLARKLNRAKINELDWKKILIFGVPGLGGAIIISYLNLLPEYDLYIFAIVLIVSALWPALKFKNKYKFALDAEGATSQIMRDVAEARKAGLGPEKCVIRTAKRKDFGLFNTVANGVANKLEWGMTLNDIFNFIKKETSDFQILINFKVLFEIISAGGGNVNTLITLAGVSEKMRNIEASKREMLKPYVMVGFMLIAITGFTTLLVIDSLTSLGGQLETDDAKKNILEADSKSRFKLLGLSILIQSWIAGLFLGKITTGNYTGGFMYSVFLVTISLMAIIIIQLKLFNVASVFG
ncbi:MAG: type II secretion system F family protein [Nitrosopumilus sp.]|uniref:type II secretion system F family protein n=1 Tax=Nitrosopumilus sp. TaxID=2024843 RepID=UPI00247E3324|nr:type II secretion system F family protein [Nitrosopumilus sp.]MCV0392266.1 type II secretion system F family protein [Nitrosopumilus sp.]